MNFSHRPTRLAATACYAALSIYATPANSFSKGTPRPIGWTESGIASMYDDAKGLTTAHKTLPIGTKIEITNHKNNKTVCVTVKDRGPYVAGRIVDLSHEASAAIGLTRTQGLTEVTIKVVNACPS